MKNEKGLTLAQLVFLIVIVLIVLVVFVPRILGYISNSKSGTFISSAQFYVDEVRNYLTLTRGFPVDQNDIVTFPISNLELDQEKQKSVFGNSWVDEKCYVVAKNVGTMEVPKYSYSIALEDEEGYCIELKDETQLRKSDVKTGGCKISIIDEFIKNGQ